IIMPVRRTLAGVLALVLKPPLAVALLMVAFAGDAPAAVVVLHSGDRIEGDIVKQTDDAVLVNRAYGRAGIRYTERIARVHIARIEESDSPTPPATQPEAIPVVVRRPSTAPATPRLPASQPSRETLTPAEKSALLDAAIE